MIKKGIIMIRFRMALILSLILSLSLTTHAQRFLGLTKSPPVATARAATLQSLVNDAAHAALSKFADNKRNAVNRYYSSMGYVNINVNQKTFCEDAYGREKVSRGPNGENRNKLTTDATARLLSEIVTGRAINQARSAQMMELLKRDFSGTSKDNDDQGHGFTGIALQGMNGAKLWSKAGWTSTTRHDAAYIELPNGAKFVLVTFTVDHANEREIIPTVARVVIDGIGSVK